jgi:TolA-binding protein
MKTPVYVSFCLFIVAVLVSLHALVRGNDGTADKLKSQMAVLERERQSSDLRAQLLASEIADYQSRVAVLMPDALKAGDLESNYPLRQLASVAGASGDILGIERASGLFEKAKLTFREKDFEGANELLTSLVSKFPESSHVAEAHFLLAESRFQLKEYAESASEIERMIEAYPENELTGFALLRLGRIFEIQDRPEDAGDIYRSILANFKQPLLTKQAKTSLQAVAL